ncbi:SDR family oxidoreductase [soil metagenome]
MSKKKILIIGGKKFVGRRTLDKMIGAEKLLNHDYDVTLFNRGTTNPEIYSSLTTIKGDRLTDDINKLKGKDFDAVIDTCGYYPDSIKKTVEILKGNAGRYIFISTCSVYDLEILNTDTKIIDENFPLLKSDEEKEVERSMKWYGNYKAEIENIILGSGIDSIIFRPALIFGRYDPTDRFYYWLYKIKNNKKLLVPESSKDVYENHTFIDDFADLIVEAIEIEKHRNIYNATTHDPETLYETINITSQLLDKDLQKIMVSNEYLEKNNIKEWEDIPLWLKDVNFAFDNTKLKQDFKTNLTPFPRAIEQTIDYYNSINWPVPKTGLNEEREIELINNINAKS